MIKLRVLPLLQPQRLFAALMIYNRGKSSTTTTTGQSMNLPRRSTFESKPIQNNQVRNYTSSTTSTSNNNSNRVFKDNYLDDSFWNFSSQGPAFAVDPANIEFIREPDDFYNHLIEGVKRATKRITFASLYLGTGKQEKQLVSEMIAACERNPELKIHILLDGLRGTRESPGETPASAKVSSATMLQPLYDQFPERVTISLYHTPDLNGLLKKMLPPRVNETIGVNHLKTYVFDNDLMMSGANLSKDYFTNRQDRYVWIYRTESIATFFDRVVATVGTISYHLGSKGAVQLASGSLDPVAQSADFKLLAEKRLAALIQPNTFYLPNNSKQSLSSPFDAPTKSTWIFPTIQMGPFNIRHDEVLTSYIFENVPADSKFYITSPYFNLTKNYLNLILSGKPQLDIITCSPEANGFFGAKGLSSAVPDCYAIIERRFLERVVDSGNEERIKVDEYIRSKWTYHAKGLWITAQQQSLPSVTLIGSPNFGSRSVEKDLEAQMIILTQDKSLQQKMEDERTYLWQDTQVADMELFKQRKISLWVKVLVYLFGNYL
ncbi:phosphatidylglycerophosphate synthase 1 [Heterostelium album PN500]|uniref:CDP-diacylglycerol--glycerol-3-phosphate 3-phosphatidyltransferase n=1 Tax=Heterostelium pallidum (strain ATCC 26659 / Pp 5 / PN500) TaxID=670386 RepID=D3B913_HETP5|nr:phosphatidylglycerophosphate synthase 1 [Heterostelium album PN500]EFA82052.1 phosphatidylglycerophosphate synthase 1 [Heterostelium album PN500]|eukprot:XP_020434169.1 phosphatidylglycerophosphate synthase 1 [Heterostelium album PN500]